MREQIKALSKETLIYGATTVVGRFLNFLLVPFYVNVLDPKMYGVSASMYTYISFVGIIYTLGLEAAYFRYASKGEGEQRGAEEEKRLFSGPFLFVLLFGGLLSAIIALVAPWLVWPAFFDPKTDITPWVPEFTRILRWSALIVLLDSLNVVPFAALRIDRRARRFGAIRLSGIVITLILNFVFVIGLRKGVEAIFVSNVVASAAMLVMLWPTVARRFEFKIDRAVMKKLLPFGLTNVPAYLSAMMVQVIDRPIVQAYLGLAMLGIYQANYRMGIVMMVFVSLFEYAWRPFFLRESRTNDERARKLFARIFTYFMLVAFMGFLVFALFLPYILTVRLPFIHHAILKSQYASGIDIIPVVLAAYIFQGMYTNFIAGIYIKEHNKVLPFITGLGAAVNILTNILLIPVLGIMGAALATLFAYIAMAAAIYWQVQKVYYVHYDWGRVGLLALLVTIGFVLGSQSAHFGLASQYDVMIRFLVVAAVIGALFALGFFSPSEVAAIRQMVRRPGSRTAEVPEPVEEARERAQ